jgi:hypothetical protein
MTRQRKRTTQVISKPILLQYELDGYGASVFTIKLMNESDWGIIVQKVRISSPKCGISNEWLGGRTSDNFATCQEVVDATKVFTDQSIIDAFLVLAGERKYIGSDDVFDCVEKALDD